MKIDVDIMQAIWLKVIVKRHLAELNNSLEHVTNNKCKAIMIEDIKAIQYILDKLTEAIDGN